MTIWYSIYELIYCWAAMRAAAAVDCLPVLFVLCANCVLLFFWFYDWWDLGVLLCNVCAGQVDLVT